MKAAKANRRIWGKANRRIWGLMFLFSWGIIILTSCSGLLQKKESAYQVPPVYRQEALNPPSEGSLWRPSYAKSFFFEDAKASRVGDIVTVLIVEDAEGSKGAQTRVSRTSTVEAETRTLLGIAEVPRLAADAEFANSFTGRGSTSRSGELTAKITALVTAVLPNGSLVIEGRREVLINEEKEYLSISGIIRPEDIRPDNTILSTYVADARIEYTGWGVINDKQHPGWLVRILDWVWPF